MFSILDLFYAGETLVKSGRRFCAFSSFELLSESQIMGSFSFEEDLVHECLVFRTRIRFIHISTVSRDTKEIRPQFPVLSALVYFSLFSHDGSMLFLLFFVKRI